MSYWFREIAGWALIVIGLGVFWQTYELLLAKRVFEAAPLTFIGFIIFRGGVHLLKVAVAAQAARNAGTAAPQPAARRPAPAAHPVGPTAAKTILPGPATSAKREPAPAARNSLD